MDVKLNGIQVNNYFQWRQWRENTTMMLFDELDVLLWVDSVEKIWEFNKNQQKNFTRLISLYFLRVFHSRIQIKYYHLSRHDLHLTVQASCMRAVASQYFNK